MLQSIPIAVAALLLATPASAGMYSKNSPVVQLDAKTFNSKIMKSNGTAIVEFYAPWCGHCKNLAPAYVKAAENLKGIATVAAIDCDEESNKRFCGEQGVQGFPTLKTFRPSTKPGGKPTVEDYNGPRTAKGVVDWVLERLPNHVARLTAAKVDDFLSKDNETAKVILFTNKGTTSPLYKSLAVDYLGSISFAQIRDKEKDAIAKFGVEKYPTLILLPGGDKPGVVYDGEMKKEPMLEFLRQVGEPNMGTPEMKKDTKSKEKKASKPSTASAADDEETSTTSTPVAKPKPTFDATIPDIPDLATFADTCLSAKSKTCVLVITPPQPPSLVSLEETNAYLQKLAPSNFRFFQIPLSVLTTDIKTQLGIANNEDQGIVIRAVNGKRGWYIKYEGDAADSDALTAWADAMRMGEGKKVKMDVKDIPTEPEHIEL